MIYLVLLVWGIVDLWLMRSNIKMSESFIEEITLLKVQNQLLTEQLKEIKRMASK